MRRHPRNFISTEYEKYLQKVKHNENAANLTNVATETVKDYHCDQR